jgi:23S rRNA (guanosine2251-2'-O)-methyltransferase
VITKAKKAGWWLAGLDNVAESTDLSVTDLATPLMLVVGSEGTGLTHSLVGQCDYLIRIEQAKTIDSLNAAIAGSLALYHLYLLDEESR